VRGVDGGRALTVHHRKQLSAFEEPAETTVDDPRGGVRELPPADPQRSQRGHAGRGSVQTAASPISQAVIWYTFGPWRRLPNGFSSNSRAATSTTMS
jgi:hypothetical protein